MTSKNGGRGRRRCTSAPCAPSSTWRRLPLVLVLAPALAWLGHIGAGAAVHRLAAGEEADRPRLIAAAAAAQDQAAQDTLDAIIQQLRDPDPRVRRGAAEVLGRMGPKAREALPALLEALADADPSVRDAAERALDRIRPPREEAGEEAAAAGAEETGSAEKEAAAGEARAPTAADGEEEEPAEERTAPAETEEGAEGAEEPAAGEPAAVVEMTDRLTFEPKEVTVRAGETVRWTNPSSVVHTVTAMKDKAANPDHVHLPEGAEPFNSGFIQPGGTYEHTFTVPGRYAYFCIPHETQGMLGTVIVEPKGGGEQAKAAGAEGPPKEEAEAEEPGGAGAGAETVTLPAARPGAALAVSRGEYLFHAAGCQSCHTDKDDDGAFLAGGRALETPVGTFYTPNITPDPETGIGGWTTDDFLTALTAGVSPEGRTYYPVFPYPWFSRMTLGDMLDLKAYLDSVEPVRNRVREHDVDAAFNFRPLIRVWKLLDFEREMPLEGPPPDAERAELWRRGSYVVNALTHCGACHTPKDTLGNYYEGLYLAGSSRIPGEYPAPNITTDRDAGIGGWTEDEIVRLLRTGVRPNGEPVRGPMAEVVADSTSRLTERDRRAIAVYLKSVPPIQHEPADPGEADGGLVGRAFDMMEGFGAVGSE